MKKLIPLLIGGMLVLTGLAAAALPCNTEKPVSTSPLDVHVTFKKGIGLGVIAVVNWTGNLTTELKINFTIQASVMLLGQGSIKMFNPQPEPPGKRAEIRSGMVIGLGRAQQIKVSVGTASVILDTAQTTGFVLGPVVFTR